MHFYQHNIKSFNNATRFLTRVERALYRDLIELYYDTEQPLPAVDFDRLARRVLAVTDEEKTALRFVLDEFFVLTGDLWTHTRCDEEIEKYRDSKSAKARAGKASAEARQKKQAETAAKRKGLKQDEKEQTRTRVEQVLNKCATNQEPITNNQEPITNIKKEPAKPKKYKFETHHHELAVRMSNPVMTRHPSSKINLDQWADSVRKLQEIDKRSREEIIELWQWVINHEGSRGFSWADTCRTPMKLRETKDGLQYFQIIKNQMRRGGPPTGGSGPKGGGQYSSVTARTIANLEEFVNGE